MAFFHIKSKPDKKPGEKNLLNLLTEILKPRWKFLLYGYFLGYGFSLLHYGIPNGIPNIYYLIPIKVSGVVIGWAMGNAVYHGLYSPGYQRGYYATIHTFIAVFLGGITALLIEGVCWILSIDSTPFYG